jgi:L-fuconate dehydratase
MQDRVIEYVDHLHEHFVSPVQIRRGHYMAPAAPGSGAEMHADALRRHRYPGGEAWA